VSLAPTTEENAAEKDLRQVVKDLARETLDRYRELNLLYRASETIGASLDAEEIPRLMLGEAERVMPSDDATFLLGDAEPPAEWASARSLIDAVRTTGRPDYTESALCVPVRAGEKVLGVVVVGRSPGRRSFTASDEKLLLGLASETGVALERARLHEHETRRLQLEEELAVAHRIQLTLLPSTVPAIAGWQFAATYRAARQVGGDFYDFLDDARDEHRLGIVIADVTGKGVPAALMMAYSRAVLRAESMAGREPAEILANTNRLIMQDSQTRLFLSAFYAEIDLDSGLLTFANAGHESPLLLLADGAGIEDLEAPGVILGAYRDIGLESRRVTLEPGDTVVMYTDGVTEARDPQRRLFGEERLAAAALAAATASADAEGVLDAVLSAVAEHTAGAEQADDLTIVVMQRTAGTDSWTE
jgi:sigma-B regulation protein RsbU (phosphoserine phosphatase)